MKNKGLCNSCVREKHCLFERRFPVFLCDEFEIEKFEITDLELQKPDKIDKKGKYVRSANE